MKIYFQEKFPCYCRAHSLNIHHIPKNSSVTIERKSFPWVAKFS